MENLSPNTRYLIVVVITILNAVQVSVEPIDSFPEWATVTITVILTAAAGLGILPPRYDRPPGN